MFVETDLVALSNACFEFAEEVPEDVQYDSLANLLNIVCSHFHALSKVAVVRFCA